MIEINLKIKGMQTTLSLDEAESLYKQLQKLFPNSAAPVKIHPHNPYRPNWYDYDWDRQKYSNIDITVK
jgi:hypothetical protein